MVQRGEEKKKKKISQNAERFFFICVCVSLWTSNSCVFYILLQRMSKTTTKPQLTYWGIFMWLIVLNGREDISFWCIFRCTKCCLCNHSHIHRNEFYSRIPWRHWMYFPVFSPQVLVKHTHWLCLQALLQILWNSSHLNSLDTLEFRLPCLTSVGCPSSAYAEPHWKGDPWINQRIDKLNW